jgi:hypothetical protein
MTGLALRSLTARFDSAGPTPEHVLAAGVTLEGGLPDRREYVRQAPSVFILTSTGRSPTNSALASHYVGVAFAGMPVDHCNTEVPGRCVHRTFTPSSSGSSWTALYDEVVTAEGDTLGVRSLEAGGRSQWLAGGIHADPVPQCQLPGRQPTPEPDRLEGAVRSS